MKRREAIQSMGAGMLGLVLSRDELARATKWAREAKRSDYAPLFFTPHEWETVRLLADIVIPADERSGGATDAGVPEFLDFIVDERTEAQIPMRGGLAWLDSESRERSGKTFVDATGADRTALLDAIAYPRNAPAALSQGVRFFSMFRDLTASGFWTSKMGIADLQYQGNEFVAEWNGCPDPALRKLDVHYEDR
jgi:gluconate 2-dehydrogenase gamma chain